MTADSGPQFHATGGRNHRNAADSINRWRTGLPGLQKRAKADRRITAEYLKLYALEGFLLRLGQSEHRDSFVLKGGVLLAAYQLRRPTADIDFAALRTTNDGAESIQLDVIAIAGIGVSRTILMTV